VILKGVGIDLVSVGRVEPEVGDEVLVVDDRRNEYAKVVVRDWVVVRDGVVGGGLALGRPGDHELLLAAVKAGTPAEEVLMRLPITTVPALATAEPSQSPVTPHRNLLGSCLPGSPLARRRRRCWPHGGLDALALHEPDPALHVNSTLNDVVIHAGFRRSRGRWRHPRT